MCRPGDRISTRGDEGSKTTSRPPETSATGAPRSVQRVWQGAGALYIIPFMVRRSNGHGLETRFGTRPGADRSRKDPQPGRVTEPL